MKLNTILVPLDGSVLAEGALPIDIPVAQGAARPARPEGKNA